MNKRIALGKSSRIFILIAGYVLFSALMLFGLRRDPNDMPSALLNQPLPEFTQPGLFPSQGSEGRGDQAEYSKADFLGEILVLNVWGSWCPPCHEEHPFLLEISEQEADISFVGISYDDSIAADRQFLEEKGNPFDYNVVDMDGSLTIDMGVTGAPETFLVDQQGVVRHRYIGALNVAKWQREFAPLLEQLR